MATLTDGIRAALNNHDLTAAAQDVKGLVCDELSRVDPSATIRRTEYFNHSYVPDVVLEWSPGATRDVYLRFFQSAEQVVEEAARVGTEGPVIIDMSPGLAGGTTGYLADAVPTEAAVQDRSAAVLITDTTATEHVRPDDAQNLVERIFVSNILRGGRGRFSDEVAARTVTAARAGFDAALNADPDGVAAVVSAARTHLAVDMDRRVEKSLQLLWWAGGGDPVAFPASVPDDFQLDPDDTRSFLASLFGGEVIDNQAFWSRLAERLTFDLLVAAGNFADSENLNQLMAELSSRLKLSHAVVDRHDRPFPPDDQLSWAIDDHFLKLRGPEWTCRFTPHGNRFSQRSRDTGTPIPLAVLIQRAQGLFVEGATIEESHRRVELRRKPVDPGGATPNDLAALSAGFEADARVRELIFKAGECTMTAEWDRMMFSSDPDATVKQVATFAVRLLAAPPTDELDGLAAFLT